MFNCSFRFYIFVSFSCFVFHIMPESIANLKRENNDLKSKVSTLTEEISRLKDLIQQQSSSAASSAEETSHSLDFLSKEYDDLLRFKTSASKELQRLSSQLSEVKARVDAIANAIDEFQEYSFQYNVKIVGVPEVCSDEAASTTSKLCVKLFKEMGENISIQDIDTAHRVPQRNNTGNPKPIICRFVRRLVKESLMSHRKEISNVTPSALGLPEESSLSSARIYDHLSPRMQAVLFQAKKVKEELHYQYCWSKGPVVCLRKDSTSRIIKLKSMADLDELKRRLASEG